MSEETKEEKKEKGVSREEFDALAAFVRKLDKKRKDASDNWKKFVQTHYGPELLEDGKIKDAGRASVSAVLGIAFLALLVVGLGVAIGELKWSPLDTSATDQGTCRVDMAGGRATITVDRVTANEISGTSSGDITTDDITVAGGTNDSLGINLDDASSATNAPVLGTITLANSSNPTNLITENNKFVDLVLYSSLTVGGARVPVASIRPSLTDADFPNVDGAILLRTYANGTNTTIVDVDENGLRVASGTLDADAALVVGTSATIGTTASVGTDLTVYDSVDVKTNVVVGGEITANGTIVGDAETIITNVANLYITNSAIFGGNVTVDGVASGDGSGLTALNAANITAAGVITAIDGSAITNLNAANVRAATVASAFDGNAITNLDAANVVAASTASAFDGGAITNLDGANLQAASVTVEGLENTAKTHDSSILVTSFGQVNRTDYVWRPRIPGTIVGATLVSDTATTSEGSSDSYTFYVTNITTGDLLGDAITTSDGSSTNELAIGVPRHLVVTNETSISSNEVIAIGFVTNTVSGTSADLDAAKLMFNIYWRPN